MISDIFREIYVSRTLYINSVYLSNKLNLKGHNNLTLQKSVILNYVHYRKGKLSKAFYRIKEQNFFKDCFVSMIVYIE